MRDFKSPKHLADYLNYLDKNNTAYNKYIEGKQQVVCKNDPSMSANTYPCRLCTYLHKHYRETQIVPDAREFWSIQDKCQDPNNFFRHIAPSLVVS